MNWYIVYVYAGKEKTVCDSLKKRIVGANLESSFDEILVPSEEIVDNVGGKRTLTERRFFPGYVLIKMKMADDTWHLVKSTANVSFFLGGDATRPTPVSQQEVDAILERVKRSSDSPVRKLTFEIGAIVRIKDGPFVDFSASIEDINYEKARMRVSVGIFGRQTPVELSFDQVEKI